MHQQVKRRSLVSPVEIIYAKFILKYIGDRASNLLPLPRIYSKSFLTRAYEGQLEGLSILLNSLSSVFGGSPWPQREHITRSLD